MQHDHALLSPFNLLNHIDYSCLRTRYPW